MRVTRENEWMYDEKVNRKQIPRHTGTEKQTLMNSRQLQTHAKKDIKREREENSPETPNYTNKSAR